MSVITGIHHFNLRVSAPELEILRDFYCEVVGLCVGPRPPFRSKGLWLYAGDIPILHLTQMNSGETVPPGSSDSLPPVPERRSALDHIALAAEGVNDAVQRLTAHKVPFTMTEVPSAGTIQIFCRDPSGNGLELIFAGPLVANISSHNRQKKVTLPAQP